jgi:hypothetical protein
MWTLALLWALSLIAAGVGGVLSAQGFLITENQQVVSGADVGFRIERTQDGMPVGHVVVRINGRWVDTAAAR